MNREIRRISRRSTHDSGLMMCDFRQSTFASGNHLQHSREKLLAKTTEIIIMLGALVQNPIREMQLGELNPDNWIAIEGIAH